MATLDWSQCSAVESIPGKVSGAWVFRGTRMPVTTDQNLRYQQNLSGRRIAIVALGRGRWRLIQPVLSKVVATIEMATPGSFALVEIPDLE